MSIGRATSAPLLSLAQQRLWFLSRLAPRDPAYHLVWVSYLRGPLDAELLRRCLNDLVARHAALRTSFAVVDGQPRPLVAPALDVPLPLVELGVPLAECPAALVKRALADDWEPFDLERGPLLRARLARFTGQDYGFALQMHHLVCDGWSIAILRRELAALYEAFRAGTAASLPPLAIEYLDFAAWQRGQLASGAMQRDLDYWRRLEGVVPLTLPGDLPPGADERSAAELVRLVPSVTWRGIERLAADCGATPFMVVLAAFNLLLHRRTGQEDIALGCPVAGRTQVETEGVVGFFVNTLVLRNDLSGNPTFRQLVARVKDVCLEAYDHQDAPFDQIVDALGVDRNPSQNPLFDIAFNYADDGALALRGFTSLRGPNLTSVPKFSLTVGLSREAGEVRLVAVHRADLYSRGAMEELLEQLLAIVGQVLAAPDAHLDDPSLLTSRARQIVGDLTGLLPDPLLPPVSELFRRAAERHPLHPALERGDVRLTYAEVATRVERLAAALVAGGLAPGEVVGFVGEAGLALPIAMLGIARAGGVFVTLERSLPPERLRMMLREAGARRLIVADEPPPGCDLPVLVLDEEGVLTAPPAGEVTLPRLAPDAPAYVFFTSGTTGRPRAVLGVHKSISQFVCWQREQFTIGEGDRAAQLTGLGFEVLLRDVLAPLVSGATLVFPPRHGAGPLSFVERAGITLFNVVPSLLQSWLASAPAGLTLERLRLVFFAGETLSGALVERFRRAFPRAGRLVVFYGTTETPQARVWSEVPPRVGPGAQPAGWPIPSTQVLVLTPRQTLAGIGEPGEVAIRSPYRTRYLDGGPTRWIANPFRQDESDLLYLTGDRGRLRSDGALEILGRLDDQLKIRGVRIDPAEVKGALEREPEVAAAAVLGRACPEHGPELVAYLVPAAPAVALAPRELRRRLRRTLPDWLVPSIFVWLARLPLLAHGKIDRQALPAARHSEEAPPYRAPSTATERRLCTIWQALLGRSEIGVDDNFFDLGGHSLLVIQALSRIRDTFDVELPVRLFFEAPTITELAAALGEGTPRAIPPAPPQERVRASSSQRRLWLLEQMRGEADPCPYNEAIAFELRGPLDEEALRASVLDLLSRHEIWRTALSLDAGTLSLRRGDAWPAEPWQAVDLGGTDEPTARHRLAELARGEALRPFDLERGPLWRLFLVRLSPELHVLLCSIHHAIMDGWSMGLVARELDLHYTARRAGRSAGLPPPPIQYRDFAAWEGAAGEAALEEGLAFFARALAGAPPVLALPADRPRPGPPDLRGARLPLHVPAETARSLARLAQEERASPSMVLLAAYALLLGRYARQDDVVLGLAVTGRVRTELEDMLGLFVNLVPVRLGFADRPSFRTLLARAREAWLDANTHQSVPLDRIVERLRPPRDARHTPLFQALLVVQNAPEAPSHLGDLALELYALDTGVARYDLTLALSDNGNGLVGFFEYATDLFDRITVERLAAHLGNLLAAVARDPDRPVTALPLLSADEQGALICGPAGTADAGTTLPLHAQLAAHVRARPDAVAVVHEDRALTYAALDRRANQIARRLLAAGAGPETRIGLCLAPSLDLVAALLGILKTGAAYVPIEAGCPGERLAFLLGDAQARALVTDQPALPLIPCPLVPIESAAAEDHSPVAERGRGDALAHVIYTSGSTGTPKGVLVEHRMVSARFAAAAPWLAAGPEDTWSLFHSIATDLSVWELWGALLHGGRLVIVPRGSPDELYALLARQAVTVLSQTPSAFRLLSAVATTRPRLGALRHLILGGEALWPDDLAAFLAHYGDERPRIFNLYGPTETTLFVTCREMSPRDLGDRRSLIGRPIAAVTAHVLDDELQPVPVGVAGELHIGGAGVARGYAGRPEETAWRFFADPFAPRPGARLYRTGDRVRLTRDGELEYLGRVDEQLKVRGHRVEPGEIEAALSRHPAVREAAVVLDSAARLVAFWVGEASDELRGHLTSLLPAHMVPATFVRMARLPRTSSGKLDRRALRALPLEAAPAPLAAPATADEQALADIWGEVLLHAPSSVDERFFDIGGNSLLVLRVLALVRERLEVELPVRTLFEAQTVRAQAAAIALARGRGAAPPIPRLPAGSSPPLSINQEWVGDEQVGLLYFRGYAGDLDLAALERGANDVVARHDTLRTSFPRVDGRRRAVVAADARVALVHHDLRALPAEARPGEALRHLREMVAPFDPSLAPLVRLAVLRMADRHHLLCVAIDHRVGDGASLTVLTEELARRYELHREGRATPCAALPVQYGDFAAWQRTLHEGPVGAAQRAHWEGLLRGVPPLALPVDWPRPAVEAPLHPGERIAWEIPPGLRPVLEQLARDERATLGMVMLAAFGSALGTWCGQRDFAVETVHANRHRPGTAELIGYLAQTWALRFRLIEGSSFRQRVRAVRDDVLRATEHADFAPLLWPQRVGFNYVVFGPLRLAGLEPWDFTPPEQLLPRKTQRPDLLFNVFQTERGLGGGMRYRSDLFRRDTIEAFLRLFDQLMAEVAAGAEERW